MIYALYYAVLAAAVVFLSIKLADYVDLIDKKTNISGAFIGGVLLAAVTSLPELFTSISATVFIKKPELVLGNILGSNIFNLAILGLIIILFTKRFNVGIVTKSNNFTIISTVIMFLLMIVSTWIGFDPTIPGINISIHSILIFVIYFFSVKYMANDSSENSEVDSNSDLTVKQIINRFIICAILLVIASIFITFVTDKLASDLNLGESLAGALFLGVATSLPEMTSCFALVKKGNINACVGNIIGSCSFNFLIISIADILYRDGSVYLGSEQTKYLILFGTISSIITTILIFVKTKTTNTVSKALIPFYIISSIAIVTCYGLFIGISSQV